MQRKNRDRILFQVSNNIHTQQYQLEKIEIEFYFKFQIIFILNNIN